MSQSISRVLSWTIIYLGCVSPYTSSDLPELKCGPHVMTLQSVKLLFGLAPSGVFPATTVTSCAVRSYRTISPLPHLAMRGGIFSVALSVGLHLPGVTWHSALWSPDFPPSLSLAATVSANSGRIAHFGRKMYFCFGFFAVIAVIYRGRQSILPLSLQTKLPSLAIGGRFPTPNGLK